MSETGGDTRDGMCSELQPLLKCPRNMEESREAISCPVIRPHRGRAPHMPARAISADSRAESSAASAGTKVDVGAGTGADIGTDAVAPRRGVAAGETYTTAASSVASPSRFRPYVRATSPPGSSS